MKDNIKRIAAAGALTAVALIFSYVETLISSFIPVPGVRLGIANIVVVLALFMMGPWEALAIGLLRIVIASVLFGNPVSFAMSLSGFALSFPVMLILKKTGKFTIPGISLGGGAAHNFGQLICAMVMLGNAGLLRFSVLFGLFGIITGMIVGFICKMIYERVKDYDWLSKGRTD